jgi:hypothetical protein
MSTTATYGETVSGIEANRADTTGNGTSTTVTYGETVSGIGAEDITITTATGKTVITTVTTKTAIKVFATIKHLRRAEDFLWGWL